LTERIAVAHDNVRVRIKSAHVSRKSGQGNWNDLTFDDDRRAYYSNIERGAEAVREAVVDLLVLAQSSIVGFTGSTFQSVAQMIGQVASLLPLDRPPELIFPALTDCLRRLTTGRMPLLEVVSLSEQLLTQGRQDDGLCLLQVALNHYYGINAFPILFNLAVALANAGRYGESEVFVDRALQSNPGYLDTYLLAAQICRSAGRNEQALKYLNIGLTYCGTKTISDKHLEFSKLITEIQFT
jgi:tetratricopeptide (TPR) repeat protein